MASTTEILFVDRGVSDLATLLRGVRPGVEAIVLDPARPAARQVAAALAGRRGLDAVHIVAHGEPGRVSFAADEWSAETLADQAADFAAIGQTLGEGGGLRLWSCFAGAGAAGAALIARLTAATGAEVAAASGLVGAEALGGAWALTVGAGVAVARAPLTAAGVAGYAGVLESVYTVSGSGDTNDVGGRPFYIYYESATNVWTLAGTANPVGTFATGPIAITQGNRISE